jgi:hexokinase
MDIGIFDDIEKIDWIKNKISQELKAVMGIEKEPGLFEMESVWLTKSEYDQIVLARQALISNVSNHYTDLQKSLAEVLSLKNMLRYYEDTLISIYNN